MNELTEEQKDMLKYYWQEKQDITRYCDFEKIKPIIQNTNPGLFKAWFDYQASIEIMNILINSL